MTGTKQSPAKTHGQVLQTFLQIPVECDTLFPIQSLQAEYQRGFVMRCEQLGMQGTEALSDNVSWNASHELAAVSVGYALNPILSSRLYDYLPLRRRVQYRLGKASIRSINTYDATRSSINYINTRLSSQKGEDNVL